MAGVEAVAAAGCAEMGSSGWCRCPGSIFSDSAALVFVVKYEVRMTAMMTMSKQTHFNGEWQTTVNTVRMVWSTLAYMGAERGNMTAETDVDRLSTKSCG